MRLAEVPRRDAPGIRAGEPPALRPAARLKVRREAMTGEKIIMRLAGFPQGMFREFVQAGRLRSGARCPSAIRRGSRIGGP